MREEFCMESKTCNTENGEPWGEWVTSETRGRGDCNVRGCDEAHFSMRLCQLHYSTAKRLGNMPPRPELIECRDCGAVVIVASLGPVPVRCETCVHHIHRERGLRKDPLRHKKRVLKKYGLTVEQYDWVVEIQGGLCAICGKPPETGNGAKYGRLSVDHDHATGQVRGLLCHHCNLMLGNAGDDPYTLLRGVIYLNAAAQ